MNDIICLVFFQLRTVLEISGLVPEEVFVIQTPEAVVVTPDMREMAVTVSTKL